MRTRYILVVGSLALLAACEGSSSSTDAGSGDAGSADAGACAACEVEAMCESRRIESGYCTSECFEAGLATSGACAAEIEAVEAFGEPLAELRRDCLQMCPIVRMCEGQNRNGPISDCACQRRCLEMASPELAAAIAAAVRCQRDARGAACD